MPKQSPLQKIRKQVAVQRRMTADALAHSAYSELEKVNDGLRYGKRGHEAQEEDESPIIRKLVRKKAKKATPKKGAKTMTQRAKKPIETIIESWRPAGGEKSTNRQKSELGQLSPTLGIARIATWRLKDFISSLGTLIAEHGEIEDILGDELVHGGESVTDVFVRFRSELVAEAVRDKINGVLLDGRKLQVEFHRA